MQVFVAICDAESATGGGQTIYRQLFRRYPQIHFTYLLDHESNDYPRPANVHGLPIGARYIRNTAKTSLMMESFCWANTIAETLRGRAFDVVEIPDFMSDFCLLPSALNEYGSTPTIAVALHGRSSRTLELEWPPVGRFDAERFQLENLLFGQSDVRYGISQFYLDEWKTVSPLPTHFVNPMAWLPFPPLQQTVRQTHSPNLHFIGRTERRKGPDLFLEMLWRLNGDSFHESSIIGAPVPITGKLDSNAYLREMIRSRQLNTVVQGQKSPAEMLEVFASRSIVAVPSRYDTLNLVALEALLAGCPTIVGSGAGACRFLNDHLPSVPFTLFDVEDLDAAARNVSELIRNYDDTRERLALAVRSLPGSLPLPDLEAIYSQRCYDPNVRERVHQLYHDIRRTETTTQPSLVRRAKQLVAKSPQLSDTMLNLQAVLATKTLAGVSNHPVSSALRSWKEFQRIRRLTAASSVDRSIKVDRLSTTTDLFGRRQLWIDLAGCFLGTDDAVKGAAYALRALRLSSHGTGKLLESVIATLHVGGFPREAKLAQLMYGNQPSAQRNEELSQWLEKSQNAARNNFEVPVEVVDDQRTPVEPRVSLIIAIDSNTRPPAHWWRQLSEQSLIMRNEAEVVLIEFRDNDRSPCRLCYPDAVQTLAGRSLISLRIDQPATQGQSWNQALRFARAPYIIHLTPREILRPAALETLVNELDIRPDIDWVQSHTLEIECDSKAQFQRDLTYFDRSDVDRVSINIDRDAISLTGSLYRRSVHDRFGYFDPGFRVLSDQEFFQRVASSIQIAIMPQTLSVLQSESGSPRNRGPEYEIELLSAWDIFRTEPGIQFAYGSDSNRLNLAIQRALGFRRVAITQSGKSLSCDLDYALRLVSYAAAQFPEFRDDRARPLKKISSLYEHLDVCEWSNSAIATIDGWRTWIAICRQFGRLAKTSEDHPQLAYFQDERFERDQFFFDKQP